MLYLFKTGKSSKFIADTDKINNRQILRKTTIFCRFDVRFGLEM